MSRPAGFIPGLRASRGLEKLIVTGKQSITEADIYLIWIEAIHLSSALEY